MSKVLTLIVVILIGCCHEQQPKSFEYRKYVLTGINRPKHFYIDLIEVDTWSEYKRVYVSKHFNKWRSLRLGDTLTLKVIKYKNGGNYYEEFDDLHHTLSIYVENNAK
jgi:hypothetical protein